VIYRLGCPNRAAAVVEALTQIASRLIGSIAKRETDMRAQRPFRLAIGISAMIACVAGACAQPGPRYPGPVYKDTERFYEPDFRAQRSDSQQGISAGRLPTVSAGPLRPHRRLMGDSTYAGSEYGLSKPSYNGLGSRPDWGLSNQ
jgi:hypothetical protein